ncbi:MAG: hypothetical protein ACYDHP_09695 [Ferrimicrobium sp.]
MASAPIHHGLIGVPFIGQQHGIYWLRLYALDAGSFVVILTEVPGNPGPSITNGISRIFESICREHKLDLTHVIFFEVWPLGVFQNQKAQYRRVSFYPSSAWEEVTLKQIENMVRGDLPKLPNHEELYRQVLALGGGVHRENSRPIFEAMLVAKLPPPHGPSRCKYKDRFDQIANNIGAEADGSSHDDLEAGRRFLATLTPEDRASCQYHRANWKAIADESVRILEQLGRCDQENYKARAELSDLDDEDRRWLVSLFDDPIRADEDEYSNGQHRGCALRFSGASRAAIHVDYELLSHEIEPGWTYVGGG